MKINNLETEQNIAINLVIYCLVFVAKASFISFNCSKVRFREF